MKRIFLLIVAGLLCMQGFAQEIDEDEYYGKFHHLGAGLSIGLDGIGIEAGTDLTKWCGLRAGVHIIPGFSYTKNATVYRDNGKEDDMDVTGSASRTTFDVMADFYPVKWFSITAGFGFGGSTVVSLEGYNNKVASKVKGHIDVDNYQIPVNENGKMEGSFKVNGFRPYLGIGFGSRAVPKHRLGFHFDMGVYFQGTPKVYSGNDEISPKSKDVDCDEKALSDYLDMFTVYPQIKFTLRGKIL